MVIALISSLNIYLVDGSSVFTLTLHAGLLLLLSGATYIGVSTLSSSLLQSFAEFGRNLSQLVSR